MCVQYNERCLCEKTPLQINMTNISSLWRQMAPTIYNLFVTNFEMNCSSPSSKERLQAVTKQNIGISLSRPTFPRHQRHTLPQCINIIYHLCYTPVRVVPYVLCLIVCSTGYRSYTSRYSRSDSIHPISNLTNIDNDILDRLCKFFFPTRQSDPHTRAQCLKNVWVLLCSVRACVCVCSCVRACVRASSRADPVSIHKAWKIRGYAACDVAA